MSVDLVLRNRQRVRTIDLRYLRRIALAILEDTASDGEVGVHLVNSTEMAKLNRCFLDHEGSTDVITLDYVGKTKSSRHEAPIIGDIFVCVDEAISQARQFRTTWQSELIRYIIHGLLHLRGFDDTAPAKRRTMKREENRLLKESSRQFPPKRLGKNS